MKTYLDGFGLVAVGGWNKQIFTPDWLKAHVCDNRDSKIEIAVPVNNLSAPIRLSFEGVYFFIDSNRLDIKPQTCDPETLNKCTIYLKRILDLLNHTPVNSLGINCSFISDGDNKEIEEKFIFGDLAHLNADEYKIESTEIKRSFSCKDESTLNFNVLLSGEDAITSFNYHWEIANANQCSEKLTNNLYPEHFDKSVNLLESIYEVKVV